MSRRGGSMGVGGNDDVGASIDFQRGLQAGRELTPTKRLRLAPAEIPVW